MNTKKEKLAEVGSRMFAYPVVKDRSSIIREGLISGFIGAGTIAVWFLIMDTYFGRPFFTPSLLGRTLFQGNVEPVQLNTLPLSFHMILVFTVIHVLAFCAVGVVAAWLIRLAERNLSLGFGLILLAVIFEFGFIAVSMAAAEFVLHELTLPAILVGNLLAMWTMGFYFWRRHPDLTVFP